MVSIAIWAICIIGAGVAIWNAKQANFFRKLSTQSEVSETERAAFYLMAQFSISGLSGHDDPRVEPLFRGWAEKSKRKHIKGAVLALAVAICCGLVLAFGPALGISNL